MKPFWWLILTACLGASWLPTAAPGPACASPAAPGHGPSLGRADLPGSPNHGPEFAWEATEPEAEPDTAGDPEARAVGPWAAEDRPRSARPTGPAPVVPRPDGADRRPASTPIRC